MAKSKKRLVYFLSPLLVLQLLFNQGNVLLAQGISGQVVDEKKEPILNAMLPVYKDGILKGGSVTDIDGYYVIKPLQPGKYTLLVICPGYDSLQKEIETGGDSLAVINFEMKRSLDREIVKKYGCILHPLVPKYGDVSGKVYDEKGTPLFDAAIYFYQGGSLLLSMITDTSGIYFFKGEQGYCDILIVCLGYDTVLLNRIIIENKLTTHVNFRLHKTGSDKNRGPMKNICTFGPEPRKPEEWEQFFLIDEIKHLPK